MIEIGKLPAGSVILESCPAGVLARLPDGTLRKIELQATLNGPAIVTTDIPGSVRLSLGSVQIGLVEQPDGSIKITP